MLARFSLRLRFLLIPLGAALASCEAAPVPSPYAVAVRVLGGYGAPLEGAAMSSAGESLGVSDREGLIVIQLFGQEGQRRRLELHCPEGYTAPRRELDIVLRRFSDDSMAPEFAVRCTPAAQRSVVVVRADGGAGLPVLHLGQTVARTDESGAAHFILETPADETIELAFDTSAQPRLRPQHPSTRFRVGEDEDVILVNQSFSLLPPQRTARHRPVRLRSAIK